MGFVLGFLLAGVPAWGNDGTRAELLTDSPVEAPLPRQVSAIGTASPEQLSLLIQQLGDPSFAVRERAGSQLAALGTGARDVLLAALENEDPEIRRRSRSLLHDVLAADLQNRFVDFLADLASLQVEGRETVHALPGWKRFREIAGDDQPARDLYAGMLRDETGLMLSLEAGDGPAAEALQLRFFQVYRQLSRPNREERTDPSVATIAALIFANSQPGITYPDNLINNPYWPQVLVSPPFRKALNEEPYQSYARRLLGQWIARSGNDQMLIQKLRYAMEFELAEGLALGVQTVRSRDQLTAPYRVYGLMAVGKLGGLPYARVLDELLNDKDECSLRIVNNQRVSIQMRDVALSWLVHLTDQNHEDYGQRAARGHFDRLNQANNGSISASSLGFDDESLRDPALEKWRSWVREHPLPELPAEGRGLLEKFPLQPSAAAQPVPEQNPKPAEEVQFAETDRRYARLLAEARDLIDRQQWANAVQILGQLLEGEGNAVRKPDHRINRRISISHEADRLIANLPEEGRRAYETANNPRAAELLRRALEDTGSPAGLEQVARQYFRTPAGGEATYRLGNEAFDRGDLLQAATLFSRLQIEHRDAARFEPQLALQLAFCWSQLGWTAEAAAVLADLRKSRPAAEVLLGGERFSVFVPGVDPLQRLMQLVRAEHPDRRSPLWAMPQGVPSRNSLQPGALPDVVARPLSASTTHPFLEQTLTALTAEKIERQEAALPSHSPLVVGKTVVWRTMTELRAADTDTGRLLWTAPHDDALSELLRVDRTRRRDELSSWLRDGIARRQWLDPTFGMLSSDGARVFCLDELGFGPGVEEARIEVLRSGRRRLDPGWLKRYCVLSAYDLATGKLIWEAGGPPAEAGQPEGIARPLAGAFFLGAPLPLGDSLFAVLTLDRHTRIVELDARTGAIRWDQALTEPGGSVSLTMDTFLPFLDMQGLWRRLGLSPTYAGGMLVCPTSGERFVGIDLATRSIRWIFRSTNESPASGQSVSGHWERAIDEALRRNGSTSWNDHTARIVDGRVILTPYDSQSLWCLDLASGELLWKAPRGNGLSIGGVFGGKVVVAGRDDVTCWNLADGSAAWKAPAEFPSGAQPCGLGCFDGNHFLVPLSSAEVISVRLDDGKIAARARSSQGTRLGHLIPLDGRLLSFTPLGVSLVRFLTERDQTTGAALAEKPHDPERLTDRGETLLALGQTAEAHAALLEAYRLEPDDRTRTLLVQSLLDTLLMARDSDEKLASELEELLAAEQRDFGLVRQAALSLKAGGHRLAAGRFLLKLASDVAALESVDAFPGAWQVRRDRWLQGQLAEIWQAAAGKDRLNLDKLIGQHSAARAAEQSLGLFGFHRSAAGLRQELADTAWEEERWLHAELALREMARRTVGQTGLTAQGEGADTKGADRMLLFSRLMQILLQRNRNAAAAAAFYRDVTAEAGAEAAAAELMSRLPDDDRTKLRAWMSTDSLWPAVKPMVEEMPQRSGVLYQYPVEVQGDGLPGTDRVNVHVSTSGRSLTLTDEFGQVRWTSALAAPPSTRYYTGNMYSHSHVALSGNLAICWLGTRVIALDTGHEAPHILWSQLTVASDEALQNLQLLAPARVRQQREATALAASAPRPLHLGLDVAVFQEERRLAAVSPLTGARLWSRDHLKRDCDLFGDEERIFVTGPDEEDALVLRAIDGRELARRTVPPLETRVKLFGRRVLTWTETEGSRQLTLTDPWQEETVWSKEFPIDSYLWPAPHGEVAVLDRAGRLLIVSGETGEVLLDRQLGALPLLEGIMFLTDSASRMIVANLPSSSKSVAGQQLPGNVMVNGRMLAFARSDGRQLWTAEIKDQQLGLDQPPEVPILVFLTQRREQDEQSYRVSDHLLCLDRRSGAILVEETLTGSNSRYQLLSKPEEKELELRTGPKSWRFRY